jgi:hypothetical protein
MLPQAESSLDNTLRYLYNTVRRVGGRLMAIEFRYRGTVWKADTPEEAVALRNELEKSDKAFEPTFEAMEQYSDFWTPDRFMEIVNGVGPLQQLLLMAVYHKPGITSKELTEELGLDSEVALAGVISGLSKQLKQHDVEPKYVFGIDVKWKGKAKTRRFLLNDFFTGAAAEQNWPDAWRKQLRRGSNDVKGKNPRTTKKETGER